MTTIDARGNLHDGAGQFSEKSNSEPAAGLASRHRDDDRAQRPFEEIQLGDEGQRLALTAALTGEPVLIVADDTQHDDAVALVHAIARLRGGPIETLDSSASLPSLVGGGPAANWEGRPQRIGTRTPGGEWTIELGVGDARIEKLADDKFLAFDRDGVQLGGHFATRAQAQSTVASSLIQPGAIARADGGVLLLEDVTDFAPSALDALRQPMETGQLSIARASSTRTFPAKVQVAMVASPCPCGHAASCQCTPFAKRRHLSRISGPLLDRSTNRLRAGGPGSSGRGSLTEADARQVLARAKEADAAAASRLAAAFGRDDARSLNDFTAAEVRRYTAEIAPERLTGLDRALERGVITLRRYDKTVRKAWAYAALDGTSEPPTDRHFDEAVRSLGI